MKGGIINDYAEGEPPGHNGACHYFLWPLSKVLLPRSYFGHSLSKGGMRGEWRRGENGHVIVSLYSSQGKGLSSMGAIVMIE